AGGGASTPLPPPSVVEPLHDAASVGARLLVVAAAGVLADHPPPEGLRVDVARELGDLPLARIAVEHAAGDLGADAPAAVAAQDEKLADVPGALAREVGAVADEHEAGEDAVDAHEERHHLRVLPEAREGRGVAVPTVVGDRPVVDGSEVVEVELHEALQDRELVRARLTKLDLHWVVLGYR